VPCKPRLISAKLNPLPPQLDTTAPFAWTGCFGTTTTGLPYIGTLPGHPLVFAVLGFGGNGITFSPIGVGIVSSAISGAIDADGKLFAFRRSKFLTKLADLSDKLSR